MKLIRMNVYPSGVEVESSAETTFIPTSTIVGVTRTKDSLILHTSHSDLRTVIEGFQDAALNMQYEAVVTMLSVK